MSNSVLYSCIIEAQTSFQEITFGVRTCSYPYFVFSLDFESTPGTLNITEYHIILSVLQ